jgi:hypothetical protein
MKNFEKFNNNGKNEWESDILFQRHPFDRESYQNLKRSDEETLMKPFDDNVRLAMGLFKTPTEEEEYIKKELARELPPPPK